MARTLKTYLTSIGFFDLAVAAPSMKAALEAWGARRNLFHQGVAWETDDAAIIKATLAKPGIVLKRGVGTKGLFQENAELPRDLPPSTPKPTLARTSALQRKLKRAPSPEAKRRQKAAVIQFDQEKARREDERARAEADRSKREAAEARGEQQRKQEADRIRGALEKARERHEKAQNNIQAQRDALDHKAEVESKRWNLERQRLEADLKKL